MPDDLPVAPEEGHAPTITIPSRQATRSVLIDGVLVDWPDGEAMPDASLSGASPSDAPAQQRDPSSGVAEGQSTNTPEQE